MKKFLKILSICLSLIICAINSHAQVALLQKAIDKIEGYKNFSYQFSYIERENYSDTVMQEGKALFLKVPSDKNYGYLFNIEEANKETKYTWINSYNGKDLTSITIGDTTNKIEKNKRDFSFRSSLLGHLKWLQGFLLKNSNQIIQANDTIINKIIYHHLVINTYDSIISKVHYFTYIHLLIDKLSDIPTYIIWNSRGTQSGQAHFYAEMHYFDYKFNLNNINIHSIEIPKRFHPMVKK